VTKAFITPVHRGCSCRRFRRRGAALGLRCERRDTPVTAKSVKRVKASRAPCWVRSWRWPPFRSGLLPVVGIDAGLSPPVVSQGA